MKALVIGNSQSVYVRDFVENMVNKMGCEIDVLSCNEGRLIPNEKVREIVVTVPQWLQRIPKLRGVFKLAKFVWTISRLGLYDICHIHFVSLKALLIAKLARKRSTRLIVSVWGSDFLRTSERFKSRQERVYDRADYITFATNEMLEKFNDYYQDKYVEKLRICTFGLAPLESLKKMKLTKEDCRRHFSIPEDAITVCVGYTAGAWHRHKEVIQSIARNKSGLPDNLFLIFPMTYGRDEKYVAEVKEEIRKLGIKNLVIDNFMTPKESAMLKMTTDVFVNVQLADALSGSMLEHLYAGSVVITGSWLPYRALDDMGIKVCKVDKVEDVGWVIRLVLADVSSWKNESSKENIYKFVSWENNIESWVRLWK